MSSPESPARPSFHHQNTQDRLREGAEPYIVFCKESNIGKDRRSVFKEMGLDDPSSPAVSAPSPASPASPASIAIL